MTAGLAFVLSGCGEASVPAAGAAAGTTSGTTTYPLSYDNCKSQVTVQRVPTRAVSLNQSATEIMIRLGLADRLVGTAYETDPVPADIAAAYRKIPLLSKGLLKHETLLAAQPDFVYSSFASFFTAQNAGERAELHKLGVPTYLTEFDCTYHASVAGGAKFEMLFDEIRAIARIFGVRDAGERLVAEQQAVVDQGRKLAEQVEGTPRLVWFYSTAASSRTPSVAGPGGLPQTVSEMLGAKNLFDDASTKWPEVSWDEIVARDPDVIVLADLTRGYPGDTAKEKIEFLKHDPLTSRLDAVRNDRFIVVPGQAMDPSIHSVDAISAVAQGLVKLGAR
ncbi:ABC transporter substrate-binding protein [Kribbella italica]|uniref:Iron complex transport system substrate-binding protein n=1 Tax=Kribbella italica TaxID=1540520 RepID=A0A7W9MU57_9ACTN|nr:ABC transporter substrate-binding protein [Kribbella italica]MBB5835845.1 iron complex transport system substrate-binding protein [Kribbella italica]